MNFDDYQTKSAKYDSFSPDGSLLSPGFLEKVLGLPGEAGEAVDKIKKIIRDKSGIVSEEDRQALAKELGDVLWYVAGIARYLDFPLSSVAEGNLAKLESRYQRNKLHGEGDNR